MTPILWAFAFAWAGADSAWQANADPDSLRQEVGALTQQGKLDAALDVTKADSSLTPSLSESLRGRLELSGEASRKAYAAAAADSESGDGVQGEALFRLGQFFYAAGQQHLAIPQFRAYLARYPTGVWAAAAARWMGYACLQFVQHRPEKTAYFDTGLAYVTNPVFGRADSTRPMRATAIQARLLLAKRDSTAAQAALQELRVNASAEELPDALWLSIRAGRNLDPAAVKSWEDSLRRQFPFSPERKEMLRPAARSGSKATAKIRPPSSERDSAASAPAQRFTLQLGAFSRAANAEQLRLRLAAKGIHARTEESMIAGKRVFRVLYGDYADAVSAQQTGSRVFNPLGYVFQVSASP